MQIRRHTKVVTRVWEADPQRVRLAQALVRLKKCDQFSKDLRNIGSIDLVDNQNEGLRLTLGFRLLAVDVAFQSWNVEFGVMKHVDRLLRELACVDLADGHSLAICPMPMHGAPMGIVPLWTGVELVASSEFANRPKQRVALGHDHDVSFAHPVAKDVRHLNPS